MSNYITKICIRALFFLKCCLWVILLEIFISMVSKSGDVTLHKKLKLHYIFTFIFQNKHEYKEKA